MPVPNIDLHWQPPSEADKGRNRMGWLNEVISAGEGQLSRSNSYKDIGATVDLISGKVGRQISESRSRLTINREKRALKEVISNIADIRAIDAFSSDNASLQSFLAMYNKIWKSVYFESKFPRAFKKATQWLIAGGYSYISPVYRNIHLTRRASKRIDFDVFSVADCLPFQLPENNDVQGAYAWTIIRFMPEFEAHSKFPLFQHLLRPVARRRYSGNAAKDRLTLAERFRFGDAPVPGAWAEQYDEIRYTYVNDLSINTTGVPMAMGSPGALESYVVPYVGQSLPTSDFNQGTRIYRQATEDDCYLYPNKRLMISQRGMDRPMYDGPAFDWHGMFPIARFSADEWPWEPGYSLAHEVFSVGEARQAFIRGLDQTAKSRADPALIYDKNSMPRKTAEQFDPYEERGRLGLDSDASDRVVRPALPPELLNFPQQWEQYLKTLEDNEDYVLGNNAMINLAKAKIASSDDAVMKAMEEAGPIVKDISHGMESPMQDIMDMCLGNVLQYYPTGRIMQYVGADGVSKEVFDLDPASMVPSHGPGEDAANGPSVLSRMERTQIFLSNIHALITPGSLHGIVQTQYKLLLMQLQRAGFMISSETVAEALDIPNFGKFEGTTQIEKWQSEQKMKLMFAQQLKELQASMALQPPALQQPAMPALASGHPQPGRPPSGTHAPELVTKGSAEGPRAVVSTSGS